MNVEDLIAKLQVLNPKAAVYIDSGGIEGEPDELRAIYAARKVSNIWKAVGTEYPERAPTMNDLLIMLSY